MSFLDQHLPIVFESDNVSTGSHRSMSISDSVDGDNLSLSELAFCMEIDGSLDHFDAPTDDSSIVKELDIAFGESTSDVLYGFGKRNKKKSKGVFVEVGRCGEGAMDVPDIGDFLAIDDDWNNVGEDQRKDQEVDFFRIEKYFSLVQPDSCGCSPHASRMKVQRCPLMA
ncbi:hypothetical protein GUITHDRAFT_155825 [Guillardia theta CCMP2712]|uniref:Uncharacterized protein n=1 Tax=Guillardia theta (strain CCMP2712) TaxID=905079 RepID=L1IE36_GUITC|nr:hypothetical protein GUITHDRAFT_155825 [Guillardia theta CCMP2712]EKX34169.1 hypothetical protein GUITHDRAFT_155825 [Guillardia theta CCMP2712]|mmetsp:Transcript_49997/g.156493  ORF Transcript_49997/g.156493 Transcript_49997/m.156493 type:complete len:169 (-) Transcript_49997:79-585(-)|eukprot:XP_005821149.1 hypothetical protein GUITHDRAFT_155825 [Guillardia theta CCMP2712]